MRKSILNRLCWSTLAILFCFAPNVVAQTTSLTLTGVSGPSMGNVYTSPYLATVGSTPNVYIICDDFAAETYMNESWTANVTNLSQLSSSSPVEWSDGYTVTGSPGSYSLGSATLTQTEAYIAAAYLATEILQAQEHGNTTAQDYDSYAMWVLFDGNSGPASSDPLTGYPYGLNSDPTDVQGALAALSAAETATSGQSLSSYTDVTIYTYVPNSSCTGGGPGCPPGPQEFRPVAAEPSYAAVLGVDLLAVLGLIGILRRRLNGIFS